MARINIEEEAHKRVSKLAGLAKCSDREALGTVSFLWGDSQDILKTHGSRDEIIEWAHLFNLSDEDVEKWISALLKSRFISRLDDGQYLIHGNKVQIETRVSNLKRATKGAKATKKKWAEMKRLGVGLKPSSRTRKPRDTQASSFSSQAKPRQGKAGQTKPGQANPIQGNPVQEEFGNTGGQAPAVAELVDLPTQIWRAYQDSYFIRYGFEPTKNSKVLGQIAHLAKRLGQDAPEVVRFYLLHNKTYYVSKMHEIGACLVDAEALHTQWKKGKAVTDSDLKRFQRSVENNQLDELIKENKI